MIEFDQIMTQFDGVIQDIYCCDCLFEAVMELLFVDYFSTYDDFVQELNRKFPTKHLFLSFHGVSILICKKAFQFIAVAKDKNTPIFKYGCMTDTVIIDGEDVEICVVCIIKIVIAEKFLERFRLVEKYRSNDKYFYM